MIPEKAKEVKCKKKMKYSMCTCGASKKIPLCDNAHREINTKLGTNYKSLKVWTNNDSVIKVLSSTWDDE